MYGKGLGFSSTLCQKYFTYGVAPPWGERQRKADHMEHCCLGMVWLSSCFWWHWAAQYRQTSRNLQTLMSPKPTTIQKKMEHFCTFHHYVVHWWCSLNGSIHLSNSRVLFKQDLTLLQFHLGRIDQNDPRKANDRSKWPTGQNTTNASHWRKRSSERKKSSSLCRLGC